MKKIFSGCCDNLYLFGKVTKYCRCNDYLTPLPIWKKIVQIVLGYHRHNYTIQNPRPHEVTGWKLWILSRIIKPTKDEPLWSWIKTNR